MPYCEIHVHVHVYHFGGLQYFLWLWCTTRTQTYLYSHWIDKSNFTLSLSKVIHVYYEMILMYAETIYTHPMHVTQN